MGELLLVFYLRPARRKASDVAIAEVLTLLQMQHAWVSEQGLPEEQGDLFWIMLPANRLDETMARLPRLGYTCAVDVLEPNFEPGSALWHRQGYHRRRIYEEDAEEARELVFRSSSLYARHGDTVAHPVVEEQRYSGRDSLIYDARLLVNLVSTSDGGCMLDPFAGEGNIVREALAGGYTTYSTDSDPALYHRLSSLGSKHMVANACTLPFADAMFDAIATELPSHCSAVSVLRGALAECVRVLKSGCKLALLGSSSQVEILRHTASDLGLQTLLVAPIDRKGMDMVVVLWQSS